MTYNKKPNIKGAFSLVEMLVVIAVIGILAAIAVPQIGSINDAANEAKDRRNAQNLASVCGSAQAAGLDFIDSNVKKTVEAIVTGDTVDSSSSPFDGTYFGLPNLSADEITGAQTYLEIANGMLVYKGDA